MVEFNKLKPGWVLNDARKRMALFPEDSDVIEVPGTDVHGRTIDEGLTAL